MSCTTMTCRTDRRPDRRRAGRSALIIAGLALSTPAAAQTGCPPWAFVPSPDGTTMPAPQALNILRGVDGGTVDDVWAVGQHGANGDTFTLALHHDGDAWTVVPTPSPGDSSSLSGITVLGPDDAWAAGDQDNNPPRPLMLRWDGDEWSIFDTGVQGVRLEGMEGIASDDVWAVGRGVNGALAIHWDGSSWDEEPVPPVGAFRNVLLDVNASAPDDVWAVGFYSEGFGHFAPLAVHWDGSSWSAMAVPNPGLPGELRGVVAFGPDDVWAVGDWFDTTIGVGGRPFITHWDGSSWNHVPLPDFPEGQASLYGIAARAPDDMFAAGTIGGSGVTPLPLLLHYDGDAWQRMEAPNSGGRAEWFRQIVAVRSQEVWAVGQYFNGSYTGTLTEHLGGPCCPPDCDGSGGLDIFDFLCFQDLFVAGDPAADCDGSLVLDVFDFLCFQDQFVAGCPQG